MLEYDKIKLEAGLLILESRGTTREAAALLIKNGYKLEVFDMVETVFQAILKSLPTGFTTEQITCGNDLHGDEVILEEKYYDERAEYYQQLLEMSK